MGSIIHRADTSKLWIKYRDESGQLKRQATEFRKGEERDAQRFLRDLEDRIDASRKAGATSGPLTFSAYSKTWLERREKLGLASVGDENSRLEVHLLPALGRRQLDQVRAHDLVELFTTIRTRPLDSTGRPPAPKTVWNIYSVLAALYRDAEIDGLVDRNPCILTEHQLGHIEDADPEWRDTAHFSVEELETLISDERLRADHRVMYALQGLAMLRHDEAARLRWRDYDSTLEPLGELVLYRTKTRVRRWMPVHPALAGILARWRLSGWLEIYGRKAEEDDLIVPTPPPNRAGNHGRGRRVPAFEERDDAWSWKRQKTDLEMLGLRHRRQHDLRRTGISLAQDDGADPGKIYPLTHNPRPGTGKTIERYTSLQWRTFCAEVAKLKVRVRTSEELQARRAVGTVPNWARSDADQSVPVRGKEPEGDPRAQ